MNWLANTIEPSMCGGDAAVCQITFTNYCYDYYDYGYDDDDDDDMIITIIVIIPVHFGSGR